MSAIFIFIGLVIVVLLFNFNKAVAQDVVLIKSEGGLEKKYYHLISTFKTEYGMKITHRTNTSITVSVRDKGIYFQFHILKAFNDLNITWTMNHLTLGTYNLKWRFSINDNQEFMLKSIKVSLDNFDEKIYNARINSVDSSSKESDVNIHNVGFFKEGFNPIMTPIIQESLDEIDEQFKLFFTEVQVAHFTKNIADLDVIRKKILLIAIRSNYREIDHIYEVLAKNIIIETNKANSNIRHGFSAQNLPQIIEAFGCLRRFVYEFADVHQTIQRTNKQN